ncbi:AlpA family transcriptional regulator [Schaalia sp. JY-X169]|uniref:helix-turn-helix transcriptional regulator n=1 Tax=Schaalia sp. JY-X169 TaxID=2758572 RepID=UPI0015F3ED54|nr:helix-turn-helix domain-containing protein [Schaalia sp. JY-X169]
MTATAERADLELKDLAEILGVSYTTVYRMKNKGELPPHIKVGGLFRWRRSTVDNWIEEQELANA